MDRFPTADRRHPGSDAMTLRDREETLVADSRAAMTPSQHVEQKLISMLKGSPLLVSHVQRRMQPGSR